MPVMKLIIFALLPNLSTDLINSFCLLAGFSELICCQTFSNHLFIVKHLKIEPVSVCLCDLYPMQPGSVLPCHIT